MTKKIGGVYAIKDEEIKREVVEINSSGIKCESYENFMKIVFNSRPDIESRKDFESQMSDVARYLVCFMPCEVDHDLENESGSASPVDAAEACVDTLLNDGGISIYVWDRHTSMCHFMEPNEYVYKSIPDTKK